jgi:acetolactate synthase I/II/III large subunit
MNLNENSKDKVSVSRFLINQIEDLNIDIVPVFQGGCSMMLIDEIGQSNKLSYVVPYHEQALAMMVESYARFRGFGVGVVTSGPGGTNLITGICCAYYDSIPCLFITGQVGAIHLKRDRAVRQIGFQETDIVSITKPITKYSVILDDPSNARYEFEKAVYLAKSGRPGPVVIDLPYNVQRAIINPTELRGFIPDVNDNLPPQNIDSSVAKVLSALKESKKPVILIGGGVRLAKQKNEIIRLIEALNIPVVSTWAATDIFDHNHPLYIGNAGKNGNPSAISTIQECDLLIGLGTSFPLKVIFDEKKFAKNAKIIAVDIDKDSLADGLISADLKIKCDLKHFLPELLRRINKSEENYLNGSDWIEKVMKNKKDAYRIDVTIENYKYISPYKFIEVLSEELAPNAIIIPDAGANVTWAAQAFKAKKGQRFHSSWGNSPMGYSVPAAIGAYYANKKAGIPVIAIIGDGGIQMNIQEFQTIVVNKVAIKIFIMNNQILGNTLHGAYAQFEGRTHGNNSETGYCAPDFIKISNAYGLPNLTLDCETNLNEKLRNILETPGPLLIDVKIDPKQWVFEHSGI